METLKIFKFKLLWILLNFQIFENVPDIFPVRRVVTDIAELSKIKTLKYFLHKMLKYFQEPPRPLTSSSWRPTRPPGSSSSGTLRPSRTRRIRSSTGEFRARSRAACRSVQFIRVLFYLSDSLWVLYLQIVWLTEVNQICEMIKSRHNCGLFYFHIQFSSIVFLLSSRNLASLNGGLHYESREIVFKIAKYG